MKTTTHSLRQSLSLLVTSLVGVLPIIARSDGTNTNTVTRVTYEIGEPAGALKSGYRLPGLFQEHFSDRVTNRITNVRFLIHLMREDFQPDISYSDRGERYLRGALLDGLSRASRDWFLEEVPIASFVRGELRDLLVDAISGHEERGILRSPFHQNEGLYIWDDSEGIRGFRFGLRPIRTSPYGYVSYARRDYTAHLRYYYTDLERHRAEVLLRLPLIKSPKKRERWEAHFGYQFDWDQFLTVRGKRNGERGDVGRFAAGLEGGVLGGELFITGYAGRERPLGAALAWRKKF